MFWLCHKNRLTKTLQTITRNLYEPRGVRIIRIYPNHTNKVELATRSYFNRIGELFKNTQVKVQPLYLGLPPRGTVLDRPVFCRRPILGTLGIVRVGAVPCNAFEQCRRWRGEELSWQALSLCGKRCQGWSREGNWKYKQRFKFFKLHIFRDDNIVYPISI